MCKPLSGSRVYFGMEVQVNLYRRAVHVLKKALQVSSRPYSKQYLYVSQISILISADDKKISLSISRAVYLKGGPLNQWVIPKA